MTITLPRTLVFTFTLCAIALTGFMFTHVAGANPSQIVQNASATATTTYSYMTPGAATTTNVFNIQTDGYYPGDTAALMICFAASTTAAVLNTGIEYSQDGVTYAENNFSALATTSPSASLQIVQKMQWLFASTSIGGAVVASTTNAGCKIVSVPTPTQYIRAVFSITGANGAVWSNWLVKRENR